MQGSGCSTRTRTQGLVTGTPYLRSSLTSSIPQALASRTGAPRGITSPRVSDSHRSGRVRACRGGSDPQQAQVQVQVQAHSQVPNTEGRKEGAHHNLQHMILSSDKQRHNGHPHSTVPARAHIPVECSAQSRGQAATRRHGLAGPPTAGWRSLHRRSRGTGRGPAWRGYATRSTSNRKETTGIGESRPTSHKFPADTSRPVHQPPPRSAFCAA